MSGDADTASARKRRPSFSVTDLVLDAAAAEAEAAAADAAPEAAAVAEEPAAVEEEEEEEATCYLYGDLQIPFAAEDAWLRIRDDEEVDDWVLLSYDDDDPTKIVVVGGGGGGLAALVAATRDDRVQWGYLKVTGVDTRRGVVSRRPKYVFCMVSGAAAPLKQKATGLLHMGAIAEVLSDAHVSFEVEGGGELSEGVVVGKLLGACGAHRPNGFDFGAGVVPTGEA